ncbi:ABC-type transporter, membrane and ATPase subunit [Corynebacterium glutamicum MB001]|uniref:ABC-type multidrug/protein/lipid transport system, ATPase component n=1 Tax=Corynebacterium glutamicum (strain ATCC 13032 / DSM 20300 / JCM 1318 / BCRC 11384 / CCUG 27702 / LMG 3730 / NBRC 12168 / NCIMB 10025 / NRRL B-2784 / 534) TaxID=196627 RepID=Q8NTR7_CORGL|nr:ABC transporter ATP-binding protein [Corynebacterium glutamicum]AGT04246.1 ABC-type transporter, membrane and ATPase subunit [Corynebacterium glutamicum MB001]ASW13025.1 ABC-type transporter, membrane and ATPase subunit [Corynebacterium glutamicum]NII98054.1 ABC-type multidrug transport system fused ATPase/permease subunit [Corynebacterium glutamicum]QYO72484.1 ABC-type transporter, membrane and ATPase subunit [Corynebacterium glutamicum]WBG74876.1 ABC transporter ATP-binding protein [Coryn
MPSLWRARRRLLLIALGVLGVLQALLAIMVSLSVAAILEGNRALVGLLLATTLGLGVAQWIQKVVAEDLGQHYVHEVRRELVGAALVPGNTASLGVTVTRASNDLTAVRNWVALGIVPMVTGLPLIAIVLVALFIQDLRTGVAVTVPLLMCVAVLPVVARWTLKRARELRKKRGRMAARIADSVMAGELLHATGAIDRELNAVTRDSDRVVIAAVRRSWATGFSRALMAMAASLGTVSIVISGHLEVSEVAGIMMLLGVLATPVAELGRVVEYRQNYKAATRILIPLLQRGSEFKHSQQKLPGLQATEGIPGVYVKGISALPGERIYLHGSADATRKWVTSLSAMEEGTDVIVNGQRLSQLPLKQRRALIGIASAHHHLSRGSVSRLVGLRVPDATVEEIEQALEQVGLNNTGKQRLKNGGHPWSTSQINKLKIASATLRTPPLLVLEGITPENLLNYPGVIISTVQENPSETWRQVNI